VYYVYILSSRSRTLYTGVTNNITRRVAQHRFGHGSSFTSKYRIRRLVHLEPFQNPLVAIGREKEIKGWVRAKKIASSKGKTPAGTTWPRAGLPSQSQRARQGFPEPGHLAWGHSEHSEESAFSRRAWEMQILRRRSLPLRGEEAPALQNDPAGSDGCS
jgi:putative endonuclease